MADKIEIRNRYNQQVLFSWKAETLKEAVEQAALRDAALRGADLRSADLRDAALSGAALRGADLRDAALRGADLRGADLRGADLRDADLRDAALRGAALRGAALRDAALRGAKMNWQSHALIAELLRRNAGDDIEKRKVAGLISISTDWCWWQWLSLASDPLFGWAMDTLAAHVIDDDGAPDILTDRAKLAAATRAQQETP